MERLVLRLGSWVAFAALAGYGAMLCLINLVNLVNNEGVGWNSHANVRLAVIGVVMGAIISLIAAPVVLVIYWFVGLIIDEATSLDPDGPYTEIIADLVTMAIAIAVVLLVLENWDALFSGLSWSGSGYSRAAFGVGLCLWSALQYLIMRPVKRDAVAAYQKKRA